MVTRMILNSDPILCFSPNTPKTKTRASPGLNSNVHSLRYAVKCNSERIVVINIPYVGKMI